MGDFTDDDREKLTQTHTVVMGLAKIADDHERRIRFTERVSWSWLLSAPGVAGLLAKIGIGS